MTGAGGINAIRALQDMPADGTAIAMVVTESLGYNAAANPDAGVTPDVVTPLTTTAGFQMAVVAPASSGWTSFEDMITAAQGGQDIRFGVMSPKLADLAYLLGEANDAEFNIISVRGGRAVMDGVVAGDMDVGFMAGIQGAGVASGDLINLASALSMPLAQTPDAPTFADLGVEFSADGYFVFVGPAGMPDDARAALTDALVAASNEGGAQEMIQRAFSGTVNISGAELDALLASDYAAAGALLEAAQ